MQALYDTEGGLLGTLTVTSWRLPIRILNRPLAWRGPVKDLSEYKLVPLADLRLNKAVRPAGYTMERMAGGIR